MTRKEVSALVRGNIRDLCPYSTARDEYSGKIGIFLDANESPYGNGYNRYPDPRHTAVREKLSRIKDMPVGNIFTGNGSDEPIDLLIRIFCVPGRDNIVAISPSYGMYGVAARINDVEVREVGLREDFSLDADKVLAACDSRTRLIFLCSPNNPTGNALDREDMLRIVRESGAMVVIDEAYADFSSKGSLRREVLEYANLVVLQTLSKAWGLAGLRLGIAFADTYVTGLMSMVKYPYNISCASQEAVLKALDSPVDGHVRVTVMEREKAAEIIAGMDFVEKVWPSEANFLLVKVDDADRCYRHLLADGIIVRNRNRVRACGGCLRITIGTPEENAALIASLGRYGDRTESGRKDSLNTNQDS